MPFLRAFFTTLVIGLSLVVGLNYGIDGTDRWRGRFVIERQIANILIAGRFAETNQDYRSQAVYRMVIDHLERTPDTVLVGSSRVMAVRDSFVGSGAVLNIGMPSANLLDAIGAIAALDAKGRLPSRLMFEVDPWVARSQAAIGTRLSSFEDVGPAFAERIGIDVAALGWRSEPPWDLLSLDQLQANLKEAVGSDQACGHVRSRDDDVTPCAVRRPDGSMKWTAAFENITPEALAAANRLALSRRGRLHGFDGFDAIDERYLDAFGKLLVSLGKRGVEVLILLHPYHHEVPAAPHYARDWRLVEQVETHLREIAAANNLPVLGSYDPTKVNCDPDEFMDVDHAKPPCLAKILAPLKERTLPTEGRNQ